MELAVPVDGNAPKILQLIKSNEIFIKFPPQNNNCQFKLVRPYTSKVHVDGVKKVLFLKPSSGVIDKEITKPPSGIEKIKVEEESTEKKPEVEAIPLVVNGANRLSPVNISSIARHDVLHQSDVISTQREFSADQGSKVTSKRRDPPPSKQSKTRARPRIRRSHHSCKTPTVPTHVPEVSTDVIRCEMAENGRAVLSVDGVLIGAMLSSKRKGRRSKTHHRMSNATLTRYKVFQCKLCSAKYLTLKNLNIHLREHDNQNTTVCEKCGVVYLSTYSFRMHQCRYTSKAILKCKRCDMRFETRLKYKEHVCRTLTSINTFSCERCDTSYTSLSKYRRHQLTHTDRSLFCCKICSAVFKTSRQFLDHSRSHTGEKPFTCDTCLDTFKSQYCLNRHRAVHIGVELHYCNICKAAFRNVLGLVRHNRTHIDHQSNVCFKCNARFTTTEELVQHSVIHDGEKPYMCYICNATFCFAHNLDQHLRLSDCASKINKG